MGHTAAAGSAQLLYAVLLWVLPLAHVVKDDGSCCIGTRAAGLCR